METKFIVPDVVTEVSLSARGRPALKRLRKSMLALDPKQLRPLNIDVPLAVSRALGVLPAVFTLRQRAAKECPGAQLDVIDELEDRALAMSTVNGDYETATATPLGFEAIVDEAFECRAGLMTVVRMLVALNYIKPEAMSSFNGGHGYRDTADDLIGIVALLQRNWATIEGKVPVTLAQMERFVGLAERLLALVGVREQTPAQASEISDLRARAFTLLDEAYDEVRRVVTFLRWREGDADDIAPALRVRLPGRRAAEKPAGEDGKADSGAAAAKAIATGAVAAPEVPSAPIGPAPSGLPRNKPFTT